MNLLDDLRQFLQTTQEQGKKPLVVILGPTASGKTALSLVLAKIFNGEIISADSRQIYKYMDIGTDKILPPQQLGIQHHLIDIVEPTQEFTVADFKRMALKTIDEIYKRQHLPIMAGGTGLYLNALIENYQIPHIPPQFDLRQELSRYYEENGAEALHKQLQERDPEAAARIHPNNVRYVIRALEINIAGNVTKTDKKGEPMFEVFAIGIEWPREALYERINLRVDQLFERGLVNEVKTLLMKGYSEKLPAMTSVGYQEIINFLKGHGTLEEAVNQMKQNTRNYAKRQVTWFKHYKNVHWITQETLTDLSKQLVASS